MKHTKRLPGTAAALNQPGEIRTKMDRRSFIGIAGAAPLLLLSTSCTPADITEILNIAQGVLTAGEGLIPVLEGSGVITPSQDSLVAAYVSESAALTGGLLSGLQGATVDPQFKGKATTLETTRAAMGALPRPVSANVQQIGTGLQKALAIDTPSMPHVTMLSNPSAYMKIGRMHKRAMKLAAHAARFV